MAAAEQKQLFTLEEANRRLPLVRAIVEDIVRLFHEVHDRRERLVRIRHLPGSRRDGSLHSEEVEQMERELDADIGRLQDFVDELQELGVELKDPVMGLVDFRTLMEGREVYLCWKLGEDEIGFWHELEAGFGGRQPIFETQIAGNGDGDEDAAGN